MADVIMPKMGDAMTEGKVLTWRKKVGDAVSKGEPVAEIETDKINVDIEAEETGTLVEIVVDAGQSAPVGAKIAAIGPPGAKPEAAKPAAAPAKPAAPAAAPAPSAPARATPGGPPAVAPTTDGRIKASPLAKRMAGLPRKTWKPPSPRDRPRPQLPRLPRALPPWSSPNRPPPVCAERSRGAWWRANSRSRTSTSQPRS